VSHFFLRKGFGSLSRALNSYKGRAFSTIFFWGSGEIKDPKRFLKNPWGRETAVYLEVDD